MINATPCIVPVLTTDAGLCMTSANWLEAGINTVSYALDSLLIKPGYNFLKQLPDLKIHLGWPGAIVLNAMNLNAGKEGLVILVSPYDGSRVKISITDLIDLVLHLRPDFVIMPKKNTQLWSELLAQCPMEIKLLLPLDESLNQPIPAVHGIYFDLADFSSFDLLLTAIDRSPVKSPYVIAQVTREQIRQLKEKDIQCIETNACALAGKQGIVYTTSGSLDLKDAATAMQFDTIEPDCHCSTCKQGFTRAYLHHLYHHTPLLCERYLIMHNMVYSRG